jgi:hypothetical protein
VGCHFGRWTRRFRRCEAADRSGAIWQELKSSISISGFVGTSTHSHSGHSGPLKLRHASLHAAHAPERWL